MARKILLADDSVTAQNMGRKILTDAGYEVVTVNNGSAALKKIAEGKPDLIVLDVYMPGYSGLEVCQRIKENPVTARIPVLLTVGKLEPFKPEEARRARADAFVVKPFEASELLSALTKLEDKIIPQAEPYKQGRFAKAVASVDQEPDGEKFGDSDEGWKARLRIPTGKPKVKDVEPDVDYAATQGKGFQDFAEKPAKKNAPAATAAEFERSLPAGLPHDITPEEIAAITAAAAQLSGGTAAAPSVNSPIPETASPEFASPETTAPSSETVDPEIAPVTFASSPQFATESENVTSQVPAEITPFVDTVQPEPMTAETSAPETQPEAEAPPVETLTTAVASVEAVAESPASEPAAVVEEMPVVPEMEAATPSLAEAPEFSPEPNPVEVANVAITEPVPAPAEAIQENTAPQPAAPESDDEVMAALQTLIPSTPAHDNGDAVSAFAAVIAAAEVAHAHAAGPRWIAEEVALAADDGTLSLEKEMQAAYAEFATQGAAHAASSSEESHPPSEAAEEVPTAHAPEQVEQPAVYAMASAAAAGDGTPTVTAVSSQAIPESPALAQSVESHAITEPAGAIAEAAAVNEVTNVGTDIVGGEIMAASWKNIRDSIAGGAAPKTAPVKEEFPEPVAVHSAPDAEAVVPAADHTATFSASDPKAIANIVDSVLAELRPKIVEEIARKLAEPKKD